LNGYAPDGTLTLSALSFTVSVNGATLTLSPEAVAALREAVAVASPTETDLMAVPEAADFIRARPQRIYDLLSQRKLKRFKDGRRTLVSRSELATYVGGL